RLFCLKPANSTGKLFYFIAMASTSKAYKKCGDPCPRYLTPDDTHDLCITCLGEEHARDVLEGAVCVHCERLSMKMLRSRLSLFSRKEGQPSAPHGSGPAAAEARRKLSLWGSQEEQELFDEEMQSEPSHSSCPAYEELLEVMERATARLDLPWKRMKKAAPRGRPDERFLSGHNPPAQVSLPFLPFSILRSSRHGISHFLHASIGSSRPVMRILRGCVSGYERMPPIEETLASYLSLGEASSLKAPSLPTEPLQRTSSLNGRAYAAAGQAVASLHTMAVLQAYQADLLKDLDKGQGLSPDEVAELRRTTDLALRASKHAASAMGRSMAAMVVTERHLWVNLADLGKKEKGFLLDAPVSPSELFGTSVETVIEKFKEVKARSAAFKTFIPRRTRSEPEHQRGPGPSRSASRGE
ncbi:hypothetical protein M9458_055577, partial [Cirrhinus mrigala]